MNENVDPARVEVRPQSPLPSTPSPHDTPPAAPTPPKTRRLAKWLFALAIAVAAFFAWQRLEDTAPTPDASPAPKSGRGAAGAGPQTIRDAEATKGDIPL